MGAKWLGLDLLDSRFELSVECTEGRALDWRRLESDSAADAKDPVSSSGFTNGGERGNSSRCGGGLDVVTFGVDEDLAAPSSCGVGQWRIDGDFGGDGQSNQVFKFTEDGNVLDELWEGAGEIVGHVACGAGCFRGGIGFRLRLSCSGGGGVDGESRTREVPCEAVGRPGDAIVSGDEPEAVLSFDGLLAALCEEVHVVEQSSDRRSVESHGDSFESIVGGNQFAGHAAIGWDSEDSHILVSHCRLHARDKLRDTVRVDRSGEGLEVACVVLDSISGGVDRAANERIGWGWIGGEPECESEVIKFEDGSMAERVDDFSCWESNPTGGGSDQ